jgi:hypothetical protein
MVFYKIKNTILKMPLLLILDCSLITFGIFKWSIDLPYWIIILWFGIFFMGFWTFIMVVNPKLKDYGEERRKRRF